MADGTQTSSEITRREFLKLSSLGIAGAIGYIIFGPKIFEWFQNIKEKEPIPNSHVVMVDFAPEESSDLLNQQHYPNNGALIKKLLGQDYKTEKQIDEEFSLGILNANSGFRPVLEKYPKMFLLYKYMRQSIINHGLIVATAIKKGWETLGMTGKKPTIEPLQEVIEQKDCSLMEQDKFGNFGVSINLSPETLIGALKKVTKPNDRRVINLSLQVGKMEYWQSPLDWDKFKRNKPRLDCFEYSGNKMCVVTTEGNITHPTYEFEQPVNLVEPTNRIPSVNATQTELKPIEIQPARIIGIKYVDGKGATLPIVFETEGKVLFETRMEAYKITDEYNDPGTRRVGAYAKDRQQNVLGLNKISEEFTESVVVAAAGNNKDDFRDEVKNLNERVITVGEWDQERNKPDLISTSYGAHLYVPNYTYEIGHGSSCSTGFVSALVDYLIDKNIPANEIRSVILTQYCSETTYIDPDGKTEKTFVLDPTKFHQ